MPEGQISRSIAHDEGLSIMRETPSLSVVSKLSHRFKTFLVVDDPHTGNPSQLVDSIDPWGNSFTEKKWL